MFYGISAGNPLIKERMDLDIEVARLKLLKSSYQNQRYRLEDNILKYFPQQIKRTKNYIEGYKSDIKRIESNTHLPDEGIYPMIVVNTEYKNRSEAGTAIIEAGKKLKPADFVKIGEYRGFEMQIKYTDSFEMNLKGNMSYRIDLGSDGAGNITSINNALKEIPDIVKEKQGEFDDLYVQIKNAEEELKNPFQYEEELNEKIQRLAFLDTQLNIDSKDSNNIENSNKVKEEYAKTKPSILQTIKEKKQIIEKQKNNIGKQPDIIL